jgi:ketosteroid isomerase-like protein
MRTIRVLVSLFALCSILDATLSGESPAKPADAAPDVAGLVARTEKANQALVRGDIDDYVALTRHAKDYTIMNPFGGAPGRGFEDSPERRKGMKQFFKSGTLKQEVVATIPSDSLFVLVTIEHVRGELGGQPEQDWTLRVTQVFRKDGSEWQLVHRHADPLGTKITVPQAAALARGAQPAR